MNILVYAISCRSGGALSVLMDFYREVCGISESEQDINWIFLLSNQCLEERKNVKIIRAPWSIKTWVHRWIYTRVTLTKLQSKYKPQAVVSLQNMMPGSVRTKKIISLHNVLPLYKCDATVLDTVRMRLKQKIVNNEIIKSLKRVDAIFVPSEWIKNKLNTKFNIEKKKIYISQLIVPDSSLKTVNTAKKEKNTTKTFFYPAASYPYKNHKVIVEACRILEQKGIKNYQVIFTFKKDENRTAQRTAEDIAKYNLNIKLVGNLPRETVMQIYEDSCLVFPSLIETDAMPLIEGKCKHSYILSADLEYAKAALDDYERKYYFDPGNGNQLADAMAGFLSGNELLTEATQMSDTDSLKHESRINTIIKISKEN